MDEMPPSRKTIVEPSRKTTVCRETEVLVVGGGPAGVAAAIAAARNGANTTLVERYNHLGGMATGGLVILIPHMSAGTRVQEVAGICQEMVDRLDAVGAARHPSRELLGSTNSAAVNELKHYHDFVVGGRVRMSAIVDPEILKCVLNEMVVEAGVNLYLHSWGAAALVDGKRVIGAIFESKSGRQAILGDLTIDATGDGDMLASAGAEFDGVVDRNARSGMLAVVFRVGDVDYRKYSDFRHSKPEEFRAAMAEIQSASGFRMLPIAAHRDDQVWVNNWVPGYDCLKVEDLTAAEIQVRKAMRAAHKILKTKVPGFERSFILDTASQIGTRGSRRLAGDYVVTAEDLKRGVVYPDTIAAIPRFQENVSAASPNRCIPYRALLPRAAEGLLVAGRCFSSDAAANDVLNLIPFCMQMGEAAGTAAALSLKGHVAPRFLPHDALQKQLRAQGVWLPEIPRLDKASGSLTTRPDGIAAEPHRS
ncbi:MAG: FAD-dependent oxidoreductase [Acidobacteriota bacterium]|nr:FAD-dependent oxidoreductase [Acidobacteriota bacterium]